MKRKTHKALGHGKEKCGEDSKLFVGTLSAECSSYFLIKFSYSNINMIAVDCVVSTKSEKSSMMILKEKGPFITKNLMHNFLSATTNS